MRFNIPGFAIAMLATTVSGHTLNCWGIATHVQWDKLEAAIADIDQPSSHDKTYWAYPGQCSDVHCYNKVNIRFCNDGSDTRYMPAQNVIDGSRVIADGCQAIYKNEVVSGGVLDHPDHWSIVIQTEARCRGD